VTQGGPRSPRETRAAQHKHKHHSLEAQGAPARVHPGTPRESQRDPGRPREAQGGPGKPRGNTSETQGGPGRPKETQGGPRSPRAQ